MWTLWSIGAPGKASQQTFSTYYPLVAAVAEAKAPVLVDLVPAGHSGLPVSVALRALLELPGKRRATAATRRAMNKLSAAARRGAELILPSPMRTDPLSIWRLPDYPTAQEVARAGEKTGGTGRGRRDAARAGMTSGPRSPTMAAPPSRPSPRPVAPRQFVAPAAEVDQAGTGRSVAEIVAGLPDEVLSVPVLGLEQVSTRVGNALRKAGIIHVRDLAGMSDERLAIVRGLAMTGVRNLAKALEALAPDESGDDLSGVLELDPSASSQERRDRHVPCSECGEPTRVVARYGTTASLTVRACVAGHADHYVEEPVPRMGATVTRPLGDAPRAPERPLPSRSDPDSVSAGAPGERRALRPVPSHERLQQLVTYVVPEAMALSEADPRECLTSEAILRSAVDAQQGWAEAASADDVSWALLEQHVDFLPMGGHRWRPRSPKERLAALRTVEARRVLRASAKALAEPDLLARMAISARGASGDAWHWPVVRLADGRIGLGSRDAGLGDDTWLQLQAAVWDRLERNGRLEEGDVARALRQGAVEARGLSPEGWAAALCPPVRAALDATGRGFVLVGAHPSGAPSGKPEAGAGSSVRARSGIMWLREPVAGSTLADLRELIEVPRGSSLSDAQVRMMLQQDGWVRDTSGTWWPAER